MLDTRKASETIAVGEDKKASIIWTGTGLREEVGIGRLNQIKAIGQQIASRDALKLRAMALRVLEDVVPGSCL
jgi:hypothetical protein